MSFSLFALVLLAPTSSADAADKSRAGVVADSPVKEPKKICRRMEADTGSRLSGAKKVCRTAAEWRTEDGRGVEGWDKLEHDAK